MEMNINQYKPIIGDLCRRHKVNKLFAFGSVLTNRFGADSDIDLLVDFDEVDLMDYVDNYFSFRDALGRVFGREIDLLEDKAIRNPVLRRNIDRTKFLIYG
jgi:predicted nucleotidyltransferase